MAPALVLVTPTSPCSVLRSSAGGSVLRRTRSRSSRSTRQGCPEHTLRRRSPPRHRRAVLPGSIASRALWRRPRRHRRLDRRRARVRGLRRAPLDALSKRPSWPGFDRRPLRLACSVTLLYGLEKAVRTDLRDLRAANVELAELRDAEVERAALEERARLARELHDGLAQDLWLAKLRTAELASMDGLPPEAGRGYRTSRRDRHRARRGAPGGRRAA